MALVSIDEGSVCVLKGESISWRNGRDRIVVSTSRCGRDNPGSNPGHGRGCEVSIMACRSAFFLLYQSPCHVDTYTAFTKNPVLVGSVEEAAPWCNG